MSAQKIILPAAANSALDMFSNRALDGVSTGFYFASAIAWMDVVRAVLTKTIKVKNNSQNFFLLTAIITTVISVVASMIISMIDKDNKARKPVYAVLPSAM